MRFNLCTGKFILNYALNYKEKPQVFQPWLPLLEGFLKFLIQIFLVLRESGTHTPFRQSNQLTPLEGGLMGENTSECNIGGLYRIRIALPYSTE